jgi:GT2 family glycosyltransferase
MLTAVDHKISDIPFISFVVLNYNGIKYLQECLTSLLEVNYTQQRYEVILVDNASTDGSVKFVQEQFPSIRIIQNQNNLGFAAGNNIGAKEAVGDYVVFLNNDMWVDPQFVNSLLQASHSNPKAVCVGAKILNWSGTQIDFGGSAAHFAGYAYQLGHGKPANSTEYNKMQPVLFACGGAMLVDRQVFLDVGGFDEDFFAVYEDLDLGWRLWLFGYTVLYAPKAIVYHKHHGTLKRFSDYKKAVLYKRNSLYAVIKNYDDTNMHHILSAAFLANSEAILTKALDENRINLADFDFTSSLPINHSAVTLDRASAATLVANHDIISHLPRIMAKRRTIQAKRSRTDEQIAKLFRWPLRYLPGVLNSTQFVLADAFGIQSLFRDLPRRILVFSSDILPYPGLPTVGSGLRAWGIGQGLIACGHEVFFSMPRAAITGRKEQVPAEVADLAWEHHTMLSIVDKVGPDIIVVCNWAIMPLLPTEHLSIPVVLDQHGPHMLERKYQNFGDYESNAKQKIDALKKADFFTCAGHKQRTYFLKWLEDAGWSDQECQEMCAPIPVSLSPELPERQPAKDLTFVYGGVFLPWQDPSLSLSVLTEIMDARNQGQLRFYGGRHPVYPVDPGMFESLLNQLEHSPHVEICGMVSHDELIHSYTHAHVAIDLMKRNPERELAFTTRTVEYLWCGLPVIYNDYSELSEYIRNYNAGWVVDPENRQAITEVIQDIFDHPEEVAERGRNAQRLVREQLSWTKTIAPLDNFIRHPRVRTHEQQTQLIRPQITARNVQYLINEALLHYRRGGFRTLWREGIAFVGRQTHWMLFSRKL